MNYSPPDLLVAWGKGGTADVVIPGSHSNSNNAANI